MKKFLIFIILILLSGCTPKQSEQIVKEKLNIVLGGSAVTLDGTVVSSETTATNEFTVGNNTNRILLVSFATYQGNTPSGITYNSDALTKISEKIGSYGEQSSIWGLLAPDVGTANVVVSGASSYYAIGIYSLYNVNQSLTMATSSAGGESAGASLALTTTADNCWVIDALESEPAATLTTSGGTQDWNLEGESYQHGSGSHILKATAGEQAMTWSLGYGARWNQCAIEVCPVGETPPATPTGSAIQSIIIFE